MAEEYEGKVTFFGVSNNDTVEDGRTYQADYEVPYELAHAPEVWEAYDVPYQPVTVVIDSTGEVVQRFEGQITYDDLKGTLEKVV